MFAAAAGRSLRTLSTCILRHGNGTGPVPCSATLLFDNIDQAGRWSLKRLYKMETAHSNSAAVPAPLKLNSAAGRTDAAFKYFTMAGGLVVVILIAWIGLRLFQRSELTRTRYGFKFLTTSTWDVPHQVYGALPFIFGTFVSAGLALVLSVPLGVGAAVFLTEYAPAKLAAVLSFLIELLAAVPSVIFGLWGFLVLCPWLNLHVSPWLVEKFGSIPLFAGPPIMTNMLAAGVVLAIMTLPFVASVSREVIKLVPPSLKEGSLALGANKWETIRSVVLPASRSGIIGAVMLGLGRAVGETMAVVMVIGNDPKINASLLQPAYSMPALLANQFNESYNDDLQLSALLEIALILFIITLVINAAARLLILLMAGRAGSSGKVGWAANLAPAVGRSAKLLTTAAIVCALVYQVIHDISRTGARGLLGPIEVIAFVYAAYASVTYWSRGRPLMWRAWRSLNGGAAASALAICTLVACAVLFFLLSYVSVQGARALNIPFFTQLPHPPGDPGGGIMNSIVGTLVLIGIASCVGIPIGLLGGIFLSEFGKSRIGTAIRFAADVLNGIPSVVIGMFAYAAFVLPFGHFSAAAGGIALGIMMIPTIIRTTEEVLRLVPGSIREASLGLGATRTRTILAIVIPAARGGVVTGIMLAIARIAGETAPLLFTAFGTDAFSTSFSQPISSMTLKIYQYAISPYDDWIAKAWAGALTLLFLVFVFSLLARLATRNRFAMR